MQDENKEDAPKTFTQEELDAIVAKEKAKAKRLAAKEAQDELATKLDGRTLEELLDLADEDADTAAAVKGQTDRELERERAKAKAAKDEADAVRRELHESRVEAALVRAGARSALVGKIVVDVEVGADREDIESAVEALVKDAPELFEAPKAPKAPGLPGQPPAPKEQPAGSAGLARAKARMEWQKSRNLP